MKGKTVITVVLFLYGLIVLGLSLNKAIPRKAEIESATPQIGLYTTGSFENNVVKQVKSYKQFGALPVTVDPGQQGKDNPFAP